MAHRSFQQPGSSYLHPCVFFHQDSYLSMVRSVIHKNIKEIVIWILLTLKQLRSLRHLISCSGKSESEVLLYCQSCIHGFNKIWIESIWKINCRKFQKADLDFTACWQLFTYYLHNIYIVLGIMNNLEMIGSIQEDVPRLLCKYYANQVVFLKINYKIRIIVSKGIKEIFLKLTMLPPVLV